MNFVCVCVFMCNLCFYFSRIFVSQLLGPTWNCVSLWVLTTSIGNHFRETFLNETFSFGIICIDLCGFHRVRGRLVSGLSDRVSCCLFNKLSLVWNRLRVAVRASFRPNFPRFDRFGFDVGNKTVDCSLATPDKCFVTVLLLLFVTGHPVCCVYLFYWRHITAWWYTCNCVSVREVVDSGSCKRIRKGIIKGKQEIENRR